MRQTQNADIPFGEKLRRVLEARSCSQSFLASQLQISRARVNNYISGRSEPDYVTLKKIANILNVSIDFLLSNTYVQKNEKVFTLASEPDFVLRSDVSNDSLMHTDEWIHLYSSQHTIPKESKKSLYEPIGWIRYKNSHKQHTPHPYALYVQDDSMHPLIMMGDIVYIQPMVIFHNFIPDSSSNNIYAVRLNEQDTVGLSIKKCYSQDDFLVFFSDNNKYSPFFINIRNILFTPIVGQVICLWRSYTNDSIFNIPVGDI